MIEATDEGPKRGERADFGDAVTFSFADAETALCGLARVGRLPNQRKLTAMTLICADGGVAAGSIEGGADSELDTWERVTVGEVELVTAEPLRSWRATCDGSDGGFALSFDALTQPVYFDEEVALGGTEATRQYEIPCTVEGTVTLSGKKRHLSCFGTRAHAWGATDWERVELGRSASAVFGPDLSILLHAVRPRGAAGHDEERLAAYRVTADGEPERYERSLLSTAYDEDRRQHTSTCELYVAGDEYPNRLAGSVACGTSLELGELQLNIAFFRWSYAGRSTIGRYDILTRR